MRVLLLLQVVAVGWSGVACANIAQLTSPAALMSVDTTLAYSGMVGSILTSPASFSAGGNTITFSAAGDRFELDQAGNTYSDTAFPDGTKILYAGGFGGSGAPVTISFAVPVSEFGFRAEEFTYGNYTIFFTVSTALSYWALLPPPGMTQIL